MDANKTTIEARIEIPCSSMMYNFNSWHHGLTSNSWLQAIVMTLHALDVEEAETFSTLELYTPTMAQDTVICANDNYVNYVILIKKKCGVLAKIVCYKILIHMQAFSLSSFINQKGKRNKTRVTVVFGHINPILFYLD